uniref:Uncharacterized protein n=1 Tax=Physcomitrium patens TaxID=3218 RepID=A0A7I4FBN5_PHYPA
MDPTVYISNSMRTDFSNIGALREQWLQNQLFTNWKGFLHNGEVSVKRLRWGA